MEVQTRTISFLAAAVGFSFHAFVAYDLRYDFGSLEGQRFF